MATLDTKTKDPFAVLEKLEWGDERWARETKIYDELQAVSNALPSPLTPDGKYIVRDLAPALIGRLIKWPMADGHALYRITSVKPLKLQHLKFCDGYQVGYETIRGTTLNVAANKVAREIAFAKLFEKKA